MYIILNNVSFRSALGIRIGSSNEMFCFEEYFSF